AVGDHGGRPAGGQTGAAERHRGCGGAVAREDNGGGGPALGGDPPEGGRPWGLDPAVQAGGHETPGGGEPHGDGAAHCERRHWRLQRGNGWAHGYWSGTVRPASSGSPKSRLAFWMAWPAAPFTRLSMAPSASKWLPEGLTAACTRQALVPEVHLVAGGAST